MKIKVFQKFFGTKIQNPGRSSLTNVLREGSKNKNQNVNFFQKGGGGPPQSLHLIKSIF